MIRTRDFLLFLVCAGFLLVGIGVTGISQLFSSSINERSTEVVFDSTEFATTTAVAVARELDREQRLQELRAKVAERGDTIRAPLANPPEPAEETIAVQVDEEIEELDDAEQLVRNCTTVGTVTMAWPAAELVITQREGRRLYLTESSAEVVTQVGTTTTTEVVVDENIYAHLPIRASAGQTNCIGQNVIGIAQDGSLLYNENHAAYSIFGPDTLIGYALDGLPIYGLNINVATDACGGVNLAGQYRYYLSDSRPAMIGCYAATPVRL